MLETVRSWLASAKRAVRSSDEPAAPMTPHSALMTMAFGLLALIFGCLMGVVVAATAGPPELTEIAQASDVGSVLSVRPVNLGALPSGAAYGLGAGLTAGLALGGSFTAVAGVNSMGGDAQQQPSSKSGALRQVLQKFSSTVYGATSEPEALTALVVGAAGLSLAAITSGGAACLGMLLAAASGFALGGLCGGTAALFLLGLSLTSGSSLGAGSGCVVGCLVGCTIGLRLWIRCLQDKFLYHPRKYSDDGASLVGTQKLGERPYVVEKLTYTFQGLLLGELEQSCILLRPQSQQAEVLWVTFGGNAMLATDWLYFIIGLLKMDHPSSPSAAFLLVDYPGYGWNHGRPAPVSVLDSSRRALKAALSSLTADGTPSPDVHIIGHSLGAAAATQLAVQLGREGCQTGRLVLSAPFLSIPHMAECILCGMPHSPCEGGLGPLAQPLARLLLRLLVPHHWNNAANVPAANKAGWRLGVVHGTKDGIVPVTMGRELHRLSKKAASAGEAVFVEVPKAAHNDVLLMALPHYARLMGFLGGSSMEEAMSAPV
eukprot:TRINITY_DN27547_c0_g1_i1.p1 TRINITY_DN27547_c0_g1~~TRINITY_DN27547_c0_g1_i1.p1  ORF type:complete len:544 (+),score=100.33 TRINITY_DN27547_c0_g1_i1:262-1893(+)